MVEQEFWKDKVVLVTGHTGFKGGWLTLWLNSLGANVIGYALEPQESPNLFTAANIERRVTSVIGDICDESLLVNTIEEFKPELVFHLAAQPLVRSSYEAPVETFRVNVLGTAVLLQAIRRTNSVKAIVNITTDKVYRNNEWPWGYREVDRLGGEDPYSSSKACSELLTESFRASFFSAEVESGVRIATARAGNVVGGGDWSYDRLVPDCLRSWARGETVFLRYPEATRPWQHVLEPLHGYLMLMEKLYNDSGQGIDNSWNFGPLTHQECSVKEFVSALSKDWGSDARWDREPIDQPHENSQLKIDSSKAMKELGWGPTWDIERTIQYTLEWYLSFYQKPHQNMLDTTLLQIRAFESDLKEKHNTEEFFK